MKKLTVVILLFAVCFFLPVSVYAGGVATVVNQIAQFGMDEIWQGKELAESVKSAERLYDQLQHLIRTEERYLKNLRSIMDVKSFDSFMGWFNRSLYISQEAERIYSGMGIKVGGKAYDLAEIDQIPDALRSEFADRHYSDLSESERYKLWTDMGLAPSNYFYLKTWQKRGEDLKKRFIAAREMHADEIEEAADRNNAVLEEYSNDDRDDNLDSNKIAMNSHATQMQIEMVLRDLSLSVDDLKDYIVTRDEEMNTPPSPVAPYSGWNNPVFSPIADMKVKSKNLDF